MKQSAAKYFEEKESTYLSDLSKYKTDSTSISSLSSPKSFSPTKRESLSRDFSNLLKPIMLLDVDENGQIKVNRDGLEYLQSLKTKIAVISVVGPYRTGKSYLLNRFAGVQAGFQLGASTNPCTKGLWIWGRPIKLSDDTHLVLLDSEGLGSYTRDENTDAKLFTMTALLSSTMIYNVMGSIDERAIESLSFIANLSKFLRSDQEENDASQYFPELVWCVRDFALELITKEKTPMTPRDYLENALACVQGTSDDDIAKNKIRRAVTDYFKNRDCYTLVRPVTDENKLREIEKLPYDELRPAFREQVEDLITYQLGRVRPKIIKGVPIEGKVYAELIMNFADALNSSALPSIPNTWERILQRESQRYLDSAIDFYSKCLKKESEGKLPMKEDDLNKMKADIAKKAENMLSEFKYSESKLFEMKEKLGKKVLEANAVLDYENTKKSKDFCSQFCQKLSEKMEKDMKLGKYKHVTQLTREFYIYKKTYLEEAKGPMKFETFTNVFLDSFVKFIESFYTTVEGAWEHQKSEIEKQLSEALGKRDAVSLLLKQEKENSANLMNELKGRADENKENLQKRIMELTDQYEERLDEMGRWKQRLEGENENLRSVIELMKIDKTYLTQTVVEEKNQKLSFKMPDNLTTTDDMKFMQQTMKSEFSYLNDSIKCLLQDTKQINEERFKMKLQIEKEREINALERSNLQKLKEAQMECEETIDRIKSTYEQEQRALKDEIRKLEKLRDNLVFSLLEKESKLKITEDKLLYSAKESKTQIDHADMLCKMSEQMLRLMKKVDKGSLE